MVDYRTGRVVNALRAKKLQPFNAAASKSGALMVCWKEEYRKIKPSENVRHRCSKCTCARVRAIKEETVSLHLVRRAEYRKTKYSR